MDELRKAIRQQLAGTGALSMIGAVVSQLQVQHPDKALLPDQALEHLRVSGCIFG
jgi:hypothetical protein